MPQQKETERVREILDSWAVRTQHNFITNGSRTHLASLIGFWNTGHDKGNPRNRMGERS